MDDINIFIQILKMSVCKFDTHTGMNKHITVYVGKFKANSIVYITKAVCRHRCVMCATWSLTEIAKVMECNLVRHGASIQVMS